VSESLDVVCGGTYCAFAGMYVGSYRTNEVSVALGPASFSAKSSADANCELNVDCEIAAMIEEGAIAGAHCSDVFVMSTSGAMSSE